MRLASLLFLGSALLAGCASDVPRRLQQAEQTFNTDGPITRLFHSALYYPDEIRLHHEGFLVGVEKSPREHISASADIRITAAQGSLNQEAAEKLLNDGKMLFVSHIIESRGQDQRVCALYNAYEFQQAPQLVPRCAQALPGAAANQAYRNGWTALAGLKTALAARLDEGSARYSHVLVITMGWNTDQEEAVRNFNSLVNSARNAGGPDFRPLVVGVTWPSKWVSQWIDPVFKLASFSNKADDADELGVTWLGVLLHDTLAPARERNIPIIAVGHSFGSRAMSAAACVGPVIYQDRPIVRAKIDHLVNWQGAFMSRRLFGDEDKGFRYPKDCPNVDNLVLTASAHDEAVKKPFWGTYAGEARSYRDYCNGQAAVRCTSAGSNGTLGSIRGSGSILYVDASALISENAFGTGGGAHSDIYRTEHGRMMLQAVGLGAPVSGPQ